MITLIARENLPLVVDHVKPDLEKALAEGDGEYVLEDLVKSLGEGRSQLWIGHYENAYDLVVVTSFEVFPKQTRLRIELIGGKNFDRYEECLGEVESFAKEHGAQRLVAFCRPGFTKLSKKHGFQVKGFQISKEL